MTRGCREPNPIFPLGAVAQCSLFPCLWRPENRTTVTTRIDCMYAHIKKKKTFLVAQMLKNLPAMWETQVWSLGWEHPLEKGMATHSSILAWTIPWTEEPTRLQSMGLQRVKHDWATEHACVVLFILFILFWNIPRGQQQSLDACSTRPRVYSQCTNCNLTEQKMT